MGSADQVESVDPVELVGHESAEQVPCPSIIHLPVLYVLRVRPHEIAKGPFMRHLYLPVDCPYLIYGPYFWGESAVDAKNRPVNQARERKGVKELHE